MSRRKSCVELDTEVERLRDEAERLQAALKHIVQNEEEDKSMSYFIARAALKERLMS